MKYFSKLIYFFLTIGSNTERRKSRIDYGNMAKIVFYYIQLIGYIYSQFESKSIVFYENDYLAQIGQYSSIPFLMIIIHYDPFTIIIYYCIFGTMCLIYVLVIFQVFYQPFPTTNIINRFIKFYFQNFQWYFLTPFHESMIGILTCGRLAYLEQHSVLDPRSCLSQISPHFLIISFSGQVLVIISGFLSLYCFRNYEFIQEDLMRKFSYFNLITIILHMMLQMASFWKDEYDHFNIIIHSIFNLILLMIAFDTYTNLPFGFCYESVYFTKCLVCSSYYEILIAIWIYSDLDDGHIFLSFCIGVPLIFGVIQAYFDKYIDKQCQLFLIQKNAYYSEHVLETICQLCHSETMQQYDFFIVIKYFGLHCRNCNDINCPCKQKLSKFINSSNKLNAPYIYIWVQYQFQKMIKELLRNPGQFKEFEQLTIKFVTFLQRYRENQVLSYKIIQDVIFTFQKLNEGKMPQFFSCLTKQIQYQNKVEMENNNRANISITSQEFITLQDFNIFYQMENKIINELIELLEFQRKLWIQKQDNQSIIENILTCSKDITNQIQKVKNTLIKFQLQREKQNVDSILVLRIKLIASLVCMEDLYIIIKFAHAIEDLEREYSNMKTTLFNNQLLFMNGSALSIISNVSSQTLGQLSQNLNDQFCNFFGYENSNFQLTKIEQLLPFQIGRIHNGLIEAFLQSGKSNRLYTTSEQFLLNSDNLIEKVNICLSMIFPVQNKQHQLIIVAHLMKQFKYNKKEIDYSKKGYILVDSNFLIFGISRNIYERINYKYFYKSKTEVDLITPEDIYDQISIQQLIPNLAGILEDYYKLLNLRNEKRILKFDYVCTREIGIFQVPQFSQSNFKTSQSILTKKFSNKQMMNIIKDINISLANLNCKTGKQYPIEFSVVQKVLQHYYKDFLTEFLYFVIEVDFLDEPKLDVTPMQQARTPALSDILRKQQIQMEQVRPSQNNVLLSNNDDSDDKIELIADITNTATKITQNEIIEQLEKVIVYINDNLIPKGLKDLSAQFLVQNILIITIIIIISNLFQYKKQIQSKCISQLSSDLEFLDAYSQTMSGSRHVIYYRDFYKILNDTEIIFDKYVLNMSKYDKIYISWQHIANGSQRLISMYENYSKLAQQSNINDITLHFINYDLKTTIDQEVLDFATYYQIMHQIFYISYQSFASSPQTYLSGKNDSYQTQLARSQVYYNFFNVSESANQTLIECETDLLDKNNQFDSIVLYYFIGLYLSIVINYLALNVYYLRVEKSIKLYVRLFKMCDQDDSVNIIHNCDKLICIVKFDRIFLRLRDFKIVLDQPKQILRNVKKKSTKQSSFILIKRKKKPEQQKYLKNKYTNYYSILLIFLISLGIIMFIFSFHLFYNHITDTIKPISNRAIKAQSARLNFIISVNRFDLYLIKTYFKIYNQLIDTREINYYITRNIQTDSFILDLLDLNLDLISKDIERLKAVSFANLILENDQTYFTLSESDQNYLLGNDVCLFTGCDMENEILKNKLFVDILAPFFKKGVVDIHNKILGLLDGAYQLISNNQTNLELLYHLNNILNDNDYLIYVLWGIDVVQFQITQFCNFFLQISEQTILQLTNDNQMFIILFGIILFIVIIIFQLMFINYLYRRYTLSKSIIKFIPLPVLFQRNIPKHLQNFRRKYEK